MSQNVHSIITSISPWLTVPDVNRASHFYKAAFDAIETYRLEDPQGGMVVRLSVNGAEFWLSSGDVERTNVGHLGGDTSRMILTIEDPDIVFKKALSAGATEIFPVGEGHGWRLGRIVDPFGLHWEIGHPLL
jgi:PhnB protein